MGNASLCHGVSSQSGSKLPHSQTPSKTVFREEMMRKQILVVSLLTLVLLPQGLLAQAGTSFKGPAELEFVEIPAGSFLMGTAIPTCPTDDPATPANEYENCMDAVNRDELPPHEVTFPCPFFIGKYEVTQKQWNEVMGFNPSVFGKGKVNTDPALHPVENISVLDTQDFSQKLNVRDPASLYRLPTEAEWEYACRAGTTGDYYGRRLQALGWFDLNSAHRTHPVGTLQPNAWGLYDMHGSAAEWCQDWYDKKYYAVSPGTNPPGPPTGTRRVIRGGGLYDSAEFCRSAYRSSGLPDDRNSSVGFRLVRLPRNP
jgi:formylglycine-generating enzyme required for sulfatase activity